MEVGMIEWNVMGRRSTFCQLPTLLRTFRIWKPDSLDKIDYKTVTLDKYNFARNKNNVLSHGSAALFEDFTKLSKVCSTVFIIYPSLSDKDLRYIEQTLAHVSFNIEWDNNDYETFFQPSDWLWYIQLVTIPTEFTAFTWPTNHTLTRGINTSSLPRTLIWAVYITERKKIQIHQEKITKST